MCTFLKGAEKRATKNEQLVLQHCCKTSSIAMLRVLPPMFKPVNKLICCKRGLMLVEKRAISLFNSFYSKVAKQVARFLLLVLPHLYHRTCINISSLSLLDNKLHFSGRGRVGKWWDQMPPTNVGRVHISVSTPYVAWVCCRFSPLFPEIFLLVLRVFLPLLKNQHFRVPRRIWTHRYIKTKS